MQIQAINPLLTPKTIPTAARHTELPAEYSAKFSGSKKMPARTSDDVFSGVKQFMKNYGPYALIGGFLTAVTGGAYMFFDGYADWLEESGFPLEKWPNTSEAVMENHHHGSPGEHGAHEGHAHDADCKHCEKGVSSASVGSYFGDAPQRLNPPSP